MKLILKDEEVEDYLRHQDDIRDLETKISELMDTVFKLNMELQRCYDEIQALSKDLSNDNSN